MWKSQHQKAHDQDKSLSLWQRQSPESLASRTRRLLQTPRSHWPSGRDSARKPRGRSAGQAAPRGTLEVRLC